jgi:hypothetical protein
LASKQELADAAYHYAMRFSVQASAHKTDRLGTFGPASSVRRIDPVTGEVMVGEVVAAPAPRARNYQQRRRRRDDYSGVDFNRQ